MSKFQEYLEQVKQESPMKLISQAFLLRNGNNVKLAERWISENSKYLNIKNIKTLEGAEKEIRKLIGSPEYRKRREAEENK